MIDLQRDGDVFTLTMNAGENRWNTTFVTEFGAALDEVEASTGPAALVTASASEKFFSNGLDLDWLAAQGDHPGGDRKVFGAQFMELMGRLITFPVPHGVRRQRPRLWRGFHVCAVPRRAHHA